MTLALREKPQPRTVPVGVASKLVIKLRLARIKVVPPKAQRVSGFACVRKCHLKTLRFDLKSDRLRTRWHRPGSTGCPRVEVPGPVCHAGKYVGQCSDIRSCWRPGGGCAIAESSRDGRAAVGGLNVVKWRPGQRVSNWPLTDAQPACSTPAMDKLTIFANRYQAGMSSLLLEMRRSERLRAAKEHKKDRLERVVQGPLISAAKILPSITTTYRRRRASCRCVARERVKNADRP